MHCCSLHTPPCSMQHRTQAVFQKRHASEPTTIATGDANSELFFPFQKPLLRAANRCAARSTHYGPGTERKHQCASKNDLYLFSSPQPTANARPHQQHTIDDLFNTGCVLHCVSEGVCRMLFAITALNHCNETVRMQHVGKHRFASHTEGTRPPKPPRPPINQSCYRL